MPPTVSHLVWHAAGQPPYPTPQQGICRVCGQDTAGVAFAAWVRDSFMDHDKLGPGTLLCVPCQFIFEEKSVVLQAQRGTATPQKMRTYSHLIDAAGQWHPLSKGDKAALTVQLQAQPGPQVAVIALSGQKHVLFRAQVGWWQVEEQAVRPDAPTLQRLLGLVTTLLHAGLRKTEIATGQVRQERLLHGGLQTMQTVRALQAQQGSVLLTLALFLAQKPEEPADGSPADPPDAGGGDDESLAGAAVAGDPDQL